MDMVRRLGQRLGGAILPALALAMGATALCAAGARASDDAKRPNVGLFDSLLETMNLKTKVGPTPDFVAATHPDPSTLGFIPTGAPHPKRPYVAKSADAVAAAKAALDAASAAQLAPRPPPAKVARPPVKPKRTAAVH